MSAARDNLMALVFRVADRHGSWEGLADETRAAMDSYAHELAEKIRAEFEEAFDANTEVLSGTDAMLAADLIDPEVTS